MCNVNLETEQTPQIILTQINNNQHHDQNCIIADSDQSKDIKGTVNCLTQKLITE